MITLIAAAAIAAHLNPVAPDLPSREPQMAANASMVALVFGAGNSIYFSASHDQGRTFSPPAKVEAAGILPLTRHRGPRVALAGSAIVITAVAGTRPDMGLHAHGLPSDGDLLMWRSTDGGKTWSRPKAVNDVPGSATEGLHSLASDGNGKLFAAWLDKRGGNGTKLYAARSTDNGATWTKNVAVYQSPGGSICECCHPSVAIDAAGQLLIMWRNSLDGSRDVYLASSPDGVTFSEPRKLGAGTWRINACPMDGGGLAVSGAKVVTAWRREGNILLDEPGRPERKIGTGKDVAVALGGGHPYAVWVNGTKLEAWTADKTQTLSETAAFPTLLALPDGVVLVAWEENGSIQIRGL